MAQNRLVVKFKNGKVLKGQTSDFFPNKEAFHLTKTDNQIERITIEDLKALFFVKDFDGNRDRQDVYNDAIPGGGRKLKVSFNDGETIIGFSVGDTPNRPGFFLMPGDLGGNNERIYVVKSSCRKVEFL